MKIKHQPIEIPETQPFKNCKLERLQYGQILRKVIEAYSEGFVLAIDSKWGTGKTTFVEMWKQYLENDGYKTLYFNAWINDFDSNPLVALLAELKTLTAKENDAKFKSLLSKGAVIAQKLLPTLIKSIAEKYIDTEIITKTIEKLSESAVDILKDEVDQYSKKKEGLIEFKLELEAFIKEKSESKPLIFIVDELDRCRPDYAVEVLEQIKHFFSVNGIVFVLAIDKIQLGNAIRGYYGNDHIDSEEYLRRFIDIEYSIPEPKAELFCNYLYGYYQFNDFFLSPDRNQHYELREDGTTFLNTATLLFNTQVATLRQQAKIFAHARLGLALFEKRSYIFPSLYFLLVYIRELRKGFYQNLIDKKYNPQEVLDNLRTIFPKTVDDYDLSNFIGIEARFIKYYERYYNEDYRRSQSMLVKEDESTREQVLVVNSGFGEKYDAMLLSSLKSLRQTSTYDVSLKFLIDKINLLTNLNT